MGKKKDKKSKGKGAEKTAMKTERRAEKKSKKMLSEKGEEDIEALIADFQAKDKKRQQSIEEKVPPPSPRCNMSMTSHPDKEELVMFGGEYFNGSKTFMYNDLLFYNIRNNDWLQIKAPNAPPPRCAHQAVVLHQGGGQLWIFGGEFASPTQSQFYHYKDLWVFHFKTKSWDKINAPGGPSSRSGHRMVAFKRQIILFGGFHDNVRDYKYYNDVYAFNLDTYTWAKLEPSGIPPSPRSACQIAVSQDQSRIIMYGGYSKERLKKDVDKGQTHTDMYILSPDGKHKDEPAPIKWKWQLLKQSGCRPSPRCGFTLVPTPGNRALFFGGVFDEEEDDENVEGKFHNDMYHLEMDKGKWHEIVLRGKRDTKEKKKRRKIKEKVEEDEEDSGAGSSEEEMDVEEDLERLKVGDSDHAETASEMENCSGGNTAVKTYDDGIFTVTVGPQTGAGGPDGAQGDNGEMHSSTEVFLPCPRMNAQLIVRSGILYMYGGMYEVGDKQITLSDMYSIDLHKLDQWKIIIPNTADALEWCGSDSSDDDEEEMEEGAVGGDEDDEDDDDDDDESDMDEEVPEVTSGEEFTSYFGRSRDYWMCQADTAAEEEGMELTGKALKKQARDMAESYYKQQISR